MLHSVLQVLNKIQRCYNCFLWYFQILESFDRIQNNRSPPVPTNTVLAQALLLPKSNMFSEIRDGETIYMNSS